MATGPPFHYHIHRHWPGNLPYKIESWKQSFCQICKRSKGYHVGPIPSNHLVFIGGLQFPACLSFPLIWIADDHIHLDKHHILTATSADPELIEDFLPSFIQPTLMASLFLGSGYAA
ncbi:hypothetical protein VP01_1454g3 [Puccinia sorghi]|uniref:Uncharacterized protein n=1 Tax=Puccinia sorghi TaxID=27349 RepID=A0A0L6VJY8_9BASI|nr:hypothetical protein VP01_1454g3 [Puccinia sorghi]